MLKRVKDALRFALLCSVGATLGCLIMRAYQEPVEFFRFFVIELLIAFVFHILLTLLSERLKSKKQ